jgi:hypothetical protein
LCLHTSPTAAGCPHAARRPAWLPELPAALFGSVLCQQLCHTLLPCLVVCVDARLEGALRHHRCFSLIHSTAPARLVTCEAAGTQCWLLYTANMPRDQCHRTAPADGDEGTTGMWHMRRHQATAHNPNSTAAPALFSPNIRSSKPLLSPPPSQVPPLKQSPHLPFTHLRAPVAPA